MDSYDNGYRRDEIVDSSRNNLLAKCVMKSITHPLDYARFLVQIGHEPMAPYRYKSIFGEERLILPNLIVYAKYIYSVDGLKGMYVGLAPKILGICVEHFSSMLISDYIKIDKNPSASIKDSDLELKKYILQVWQRIVKTCSLYHPLNAIKLITWKKCAINSSKEMLCTATSIILSHPLQVVSMRMMAQFVGYENRYTVVLQSILLISREEGLNGLYAGVISRLLSGLGTVILINVAKQAFSRYLFDPSPMTLNIADFVATYVANAVTYPFNVVTACTAINNCGLAAGMPPDMPVFGNWLDCMKYLYRFDNLNRGSSTWYRRVPHAQSKLLRLH